MITDYTELVKELLRVGTCAPGYEPLLSKAADAIEELQKRLCESIPKGDYEPSNCRWVSVREQANNKKKTLYIEYCGETLPLSFWADKLGVPYHTLYDRLYRYGWSVESAFSEPKRRKV